ncbi:S41 family peptidase [Mariniflexile sp. HNIBRBA6329]|uniref:S41 family peptidase n=1 Tax=Mariniflexile sp. HNIBRBA6329 TaxID=3373088 RepID=UPI003744C7A6
MKKIIGFVLVLMCLGSCTSVKKYNEQITRLHAVEDLKTDVDKVYQQLKSNHPKLYQYTPKAVLDFKFDSLKTTIVTPINSREFYKKLAPVVAQVKQGHISVGSANRHFTKKERNKLKKKKFEFYDLDFEYLNNKLWVSNTKGEDSTLIGSEVVKIDNEDTDYLLNIYKTWFSSDGYNKTLYNKYVGKGFSALYYKDKGFKDSLSMTFKLKDSLFSRTLKRVEKEKKKDSVAIDSFKPSKTLKLSPSEKKENRKAAKEKRKFDRKHGFINKTEGYTRTFKFLEADSTVAYMNIKSFSNGNYRKFYKESFELLDSLKTQHLILDLRDNGGGRIAEVDYLYAYLTNESYKLVEESEVNTRLPYFKYLLSNTMPLAVKVSTVLVSPAIIVQNLIKTKKKDDKIYYKLRFSKEKEPHPLNYNGQLYVLINGNSFSASSLLSTHLKANNRAVFVGEETGGAYNGCVAGIYKIYEMPTSKLKIRMGLMQIEAPQKQTPDGYGIKPDVEIVPTIEDIKQHKDPELDWILNTIKTNEKL